MVLKYFEILCVNFKIFYIDSKICVDSHFSHTFTLDGETRFLLLKNHIKNSFEFPLILFFLRENKIRNKTLT